MKAVILNAEEQIIGVESKDLHLLNGVFKSPVEYFDDALSELDIFEVLEKKYASNLKRLFNPRICLEILDIA